MGLGRSAAVVIGSFPLGESDRVVTFYTRDFGKVRGVAKASRRIRSRFSGALELFTLGELVFFDGGRSELVQVDHFDIVRPFAHLREDLERLGRAAWIVECVSRLTAEHDRHAALYGLLVRSLRALEGPTPPARVAVCFGVRGLDALGHRPRLDACTVCGRAYPFRHAALGAGGLVCEACARSETGLVLISGAAVTAFERLRLARWEEALAAPLGRSEVELGALLDLQMSRLIGQPTRSAKFLRELKRLEPTAGGRP
ncbi:MAG: DNA repair protein RecO [Candidatus Rokuibacteriota bacterium]|jgi:DNA repair protein RecO (recombination protein O)|nr:MAG: DNA repair protein RecO [Candidatus Rokubacteria bacterium]